VTGGEISEIVVRTRFLDPGLRCLGRRRTRWRKVRALRQCARINAELTVPSMVASELSALRRGWTLWHLMELFLGVCQVSAKRISSAPTLPCSSYFFSACGGCLRASSTSGRVAKPVFRRIFLLAACRTACAFERFAGSYLLVLRHSTEFGSRPAQLGKSLAAVAVLNTKLRCQASGLAALIRRAIARAPKSKIGVIQIQHYLKVAEGVTEETVRPGNSSVAVNSCHPVALAAMLVERSLRRVQSPPSPSSFHAGAFPGNARLWIGAIRLYSISAGKE